MNAKTKRRMVVVTGIIVVVLIVVLAVVGGSTAAKSISVAQAADGSHHAEREPNQDDPAAKAELFA